MTTEKSTPFLSCIPVKFESSCFRFPHWKDKRLRISKIFFGILDHCASLLSNVIFYFQNLMVRPIEVSFVCVKKEAVYGPK